MPQRRDSGFLDVLILAFIALLVAVIGHREGAPGPSDAKMKANSLANLVRIAEKLGLTFTTMEDSAARRSWFAAVVTASGFQLRL